ncbi:hypothetical protein LINPERPRIM_LOCUS33321 [Linum perenne]
MNSKHTAVGSSSSSKISASDGFVFHHKREAVLKIAGTPNNFGRLFYRCPYWNDKKADCGFFKWAEYRDRVAEAGTGDEVMSRNVELDAKLNDFKSALTEATDMVAQGGRSRVKGLVREEGSLVVVVTGLNRE